jgi:NADH-quinone oxidoreductase subunit J
VSVLVLASELAPVVTESGAGPGTGEAIAFWVLGPLAAIAAIMMVLSRNAVHAALFLAAVMLSLAGLYAAQDAPFLAAAQVIVYTGAILMLFLFVLMLVGVDSSDSLIETLRGHRVLALLVGLGFAALLMGHHRERRGRRRRHGRLGRAGHRERGRQRRRHRPAAVHRLPVRLRGHQRAAHHRRPRRDGARAQGAHHPQDDAARDGPPALRQRPPVPAARARASTPATTPRPRPALLPDGSEAKDSVSPILESTSGGQTNEDTVQS